MILNIELLQTFPIWMKGEETKSDFVNQETVSLYDVMYSKCKLSDKILFVYLYFKHRTDLYDEIKSSRLFKKHVNTPLGLTDSTEEQKLISQIIWIILNNKKIVAYINIEYCGDLLVKLDTLYIYVSEFNKTATLVKKEKWEYFISKGKHLNRITYPASDLIKNAILNNRTLHEKEFKLFQNILNHI